MRYDLNRKIQKKTRIRRYMNSVPVLLVVYGVDRSRRVIYGMRMMYGLELEEMRCKVKNMSVFTAEKVQIYFSMRAMTIIHEEFLF